MARVTSHKMFDIGIARTIRGTLKRFVAIAVICALGVTMLVGLKAACVDLRESADEFFDAQSLFDVRVQSTLGLTQDDVDSLASLDGVEKAVGGWTETDYTTVGSGSSKVDVRALSDTGINEPEVVDGRLPQTAGEVAVTERYLADSGASIGDTVTFRSEADEDAQAASDDDLVDVGDDSAVFERKEYTITGVVLDPMDINAGGQSMSFRSTGGADYAFFVLPDDVLVDTFTVVYLRVDGASALLCYSDGYDGLVNAVNDEIEQIRPNREDRRTSEVRDAANAKIDEKEQDALSELADAEGELDDAQAQIDDGMAQLESGREELSLQETLARSELASAQQQIDDGYAQVAAGETELDSREAEANDGLAQVDDGLAQLSDAEAKTTSDISAQRDALDAQKATLAASRSQLEGAAQTVATALGSAWPADAWTTLTQTGDATSQAAVDAATSVYVASAEAAIDAAEAGLDPTTAEGAAAIAELEAQRAQAQAAAQLGPSMASVVQGEAQLADGYAQLDAAQEDALAQIADKRQELETTRSTIVSGLDQIAAGREQLAETRATLDESAATLADQRASTLSQLSSARDELDANAVTLADSQAELDDGRAEYEQNRTDALQKIADARGEVASISDAVWYVQDRSSLSSYASVESDASAIEALGTVFPAIFFLVAVLISLTTITRMVEEERELIGLYKALGYGRGRILSKYVVYALSACLAGGIAGNVLGFVVLPEIIFVFFRIMYALPSFTLHFDLASAVLAVALFAVGVVGATVITCRGEMREKPASLMRPKPPRAGSRIFLENIRPLWSRMSFLSKVTARNLLRYRRRFVMTVFGIAGCTALLICGFGIRDTVISLPDRQYGAGGVTQYDLLAVTSSDDLDGLASDLQEKDGVDDLVKVYTDSVTVVSGSDRESAQLVVEPEGESLDGFVSLRDASGASVSPTDDGALVTVNAMQVMGLSTGSAITVENSRLDKGPTTVAAEVTNYLGNAVYLTETGYEDAFGEKAASNAVLVHLSGNADEQIAFSEELAKDSRVLSVVCTQKYVRDFSTAFTLINLVVYVLLLLAAALSFTVVFTLSNTNISERERELATIKVLGFKRREVHRYVNKETLVLTGIGVVVGLPLGYALARCLTYVLAMPSLYFDVTVAPVSYVVSAALAILFTLVVNVMTDRSLDRIDMVGALKSAE